MKSTFLAIVILSLVACTQTPTTPSEGDIETAIAQTLSAQPTSTDTPLPSATSTPSPTSTPTKIPLSELDLSTLLIQPGDLPADISGGQISKTPPEMFDELPQAEYEIDQRLERNGDVEGGVTVFLYENKDDLQLAYDTLELGDMKESITGVGEKAEFVNISMELLGMKINSSDLAFVRCNALAYVRLSDVDQGQIVSYAQVLDKRLAKIICESPADILQTDSIPEPANTSTPVPTLNLSLGSLRIFENLGEVTSADVRVALNKVICMDEPTSNAVGIEWPKMEELVNANYICTFFVVIHNGANRPIAYNHNDTYFVVGDVQSSLGDCRYCLSGIEPFDAIQPGVTADITFVMPFPKLPDSFPVRIMFVLGELFEPDSYENITERIAIEKILEE